MVMREVSAKYFISPTEGSSKSYALIPAQSGLYGISRNLGYGSAKPLPGSYRRIGSSNYASLNPKYHSRSYGLSSI